MGFCTESDTPEQLTLSLSIVSNSEIGCLVPPILCPWGKRECSFEIKSIVPKVEFL